MTLAYNILYCLSDHVTGAVALTYDIMNAPLQTLYGENSNETVQARWKACRASPTYKYRATKNEMCLKVQIPVFEFPLKQETSLAILTTVKDNSPVWRER